MLLQPLYMHVTFFKKSAIPETSEDLREFIRSLARCGVDLGSYTNAYNAEDDDR